MLFKSSIVYKPWVWIQCIYSPNIETPNIFSYMSIVHWSHGTYITNREMPRANNLPSACMKALRAHLYSRNIESPNIFSFTSIIYCSRGTYMYITNEEILKGNKKLCNMDNQWIIFQTVHCFNNTFIRWLLLLHVFVIMLSQIIFANLRIHKVGPFCDACHHNNA